MTIPSVNSSLLPDRFRVCPGDNQALTYFAFIWLAFALVFGMRIVECIDSDLHTLTTFQYVSNTLRSGPALPCLGHIIHSEPILGHFTSRPWHCLAEIRS